jgi:cytochrome b561
MKYSRSMRILHWVMAVIIIGMIGLGITIMSLPDNDPMGDVLLWWHKSFGMLVLLLVGARLLIRFRSVIPALPRGISQLEARAAHAAHVAMYALMLLVPLTGYAMSSVFTQSDGVFFFGILLPELLPKNDAWFPVLEEAHHFLAFTLLGLVVLHAAGALKHRFLDRGREEDVLSRMS